MMRHFRVSSCLMVLCAIFSLLLSFPSQGRAEEEFIIGISTPSADHGWTGGIVWWTQRAVAEFSASHPNVQLIYRISENEKEQGRDIEALLAQKINALVILPHKPAVLTTALNKVRKAGIYIVVVDRSSLKLPKDIYVAGDNYGFGRESGDFLAAHLQGKGNILVMEGIPCEGNTMRVTGFRDALTTFPDIVVMDSQPAYWNPAKGYELMRQYLQQYPNIDAVWCGDDDVMEGALRAYQESERADVRFFLGGGGSKRIISAILQGDPLIPATVTYPPKMIYEAIGYAVEHLLEGKDFEREIVIPSELVTRENGDSFYYPDNIY